MNEITIEEMIDHMEMDYNRWMGDATDMHYRRPGFEHTKQEVLDYYIAEAEQKAKVAEAIMNKLKGGV